MAPSNKTANKTALRQQLANTHFDAVVIGGGISGAWIACQLSEQGYSVAILERNDFASETSSASSKLLHGGIRYLQQLQFSKVRESSMERAEYLTAAPHLAAAVPFLVPTYNDLKRGKVVLNCGMLAYQALGIGQVAKLAKAGVALPNTSNLSKEQLLQTCRIAPDRLTGAVSFPEFHLYDSERCVWAIVATAIAHGAVAANYTVADAIVCDGQRVTGVKARLASDNEHIQVNASMVINAAGPWVDELTQSMDHTHSAPRTIQDYATGAHLITRQLVKDYAVAITTQQQSNATLGRGGRHIFIIPWRGLSLIGTSYRETDDPNDASLLLQDDIDQLLESVNAALPDARLLPEDVVSAYSGLYPLRMGNSDSKVYSGSGEYLIVDHAAEHAGHSRIDGLVTALGAKFTTGRILAQKTTGLCAQKFKQAGIVPTATRRQASTSQSMRLSNARYDRYDDFLEATQKKLSGRFTEEQITHLVRCYGSEVEQFIAFVDSTTVESPELLCQPIMTSQPDLFGQIAWAVEHELALHLDDVLLRRTSIGLLGIDTDAIRQVADIMATRLAWSREQTRSEVEAAVQRQNNIHEAVSHYYQQHPTSLANAS